MEYLYHATDRENLGKILMGSIKVGSDGVVYLADSAENALKFVLLRNYKKILVIKICVSKLDKDLLSESYDHSEDFFKCKAWQYRGNIKNRAFEEFVEYECDISKIFK